VEHLGVEPNAGCTQFRHPLQGYAATQCRVMPPPVCKGTLTMLATGFDVALTKASESVAWGVGAAVTFASCADIMIVERSRAVIKNGWTQLRVIGDSPLTPKDSSGWRRLDVSKALAVWSLTRRRSSDSATLDADLESGLYGSTRGPLNVIHKQLSCDCEHSLRRMSWNARKHCTNHARLIRIYLLSTSAQ
jgi:hypothetical protein